MLTNNYFYNVVWNDTYCFKWKSRQQAIIDLICYNFFAAYWFFLWQNISTDISAMAQQFGKVACILEKLSLDGFWV